MIYIRSMQESDYEAVQHIYRKGVQTGNASYKAELPPLFQDFIATRIAEYALVACEKNKDDSPDKVVGWATVRQGWWPWTVENSIYVGSEGRGIGSLLLEALIKKCTNTHIGAIHALIFPENEASRALHTKVGFKEVGRLHQVIHLNDIWRDAIVMEYVLDTRK